MHEKKIQIIGNRYRKSLRWKVRRFFVFALFHDAFCVRVMGLIVATKQFHHHQYVLISSPTAARVHHSYMRKSHLLVPPSAQIHHPSPCRCSRLSTGPGSASGS